MARYPIPLAAVLSAASILRRGGARPRSLLEHPHRALVTSGRVAIGLALQAIGAGPGDLVLMPAYHSLSMIPPLLACGAAPRFYRVGADAAVDLDDLERQRTDAVKALLVTHYFGFLQDLAPLRAWCDRHGIALIEDCAHSFFGERDGLAPGAVGDYAIASSMKFFPLYEGGALVCARHRLDQFALRSAGAGFELKAALAVFERSFAHGRLPLLRRLLWAPLALKDALWSARKRRQPAAQALTPASSDSDYAFDPRWLDKRSAWCSRLLLALVARARIVERRRAHYQALAAAVAGLPGCRPLFATLPDGVCPWQFPLWVDDPEPLFDRLHAAGVPMVRFAERLWDGVDATVCPHSVALSRQVIAFPCHQEMRPAELDWIARQLRQELLR